MRTIIISPNVGRKLRLMGEKIIVTQRASLTHPPSKTHRQTPVFRLAIYFYSTLFAQRCQKLVTPLPSAGEGEHLNANAWTRVSFRTPVNTGPSFS